MMFLLVDFLLFDDRQSCVRMMVHDERRSHIKMMIGMHTKELIAWDGGSGCGGDEVVDCCIFIIRCCV